MPCTLTPLELLLFKQIRLVGGTTKVQSFKPSDTLKDVLIWLGTPTTLMTTFPKRVFTSEDAEKTLKDLGTHTIIQA